MDSAIRASGEVPLPRPHTTPLPTASNVPTALLFAVILRRGWAVPGLEQLRPVWRSGARLSAARACQPGHHLPGGSSSSEQSNALTLILLPSTGTSREVQPASSMVHPAGRCVKGMSRVFAGAVSASHPVASGTGDRQGRRPALHCGNRTPLQAAPLAQPSFARARAAARRTVDQDSRRSALSAGPIKIS